MNNLTPHGPWFVDQVETNPTDSVFHVLAPTNDIGSDDGAWFIAECLDRRIAYLIAAAPDMLEALEPLQAWAENERRRHAHAGEENEAEYMGRLADTAKAAIAKARGLQ